MFLVKEYLYPIPLKIGDIYNHLLNLYASLNVSTLSRLKLINF